MEKQISLRKIGLHSLALLATLWATLNQAHSQQYIRGVITAISDGDTVALQPEGTQGARARLRIRMLGMDTPELHLPTDQGMVGQGEWGQLATDHLRTLINVGSQVTLEAHGTDRYGRTLGRIFVGNEDINYKMVRDGWAPPYIICSGSECAPGYFEQQHVHDYFAACAAARTEGRGIWNPSNPLTEMPFEFRMRMQHRGPDRIVGDYYTRQYFAPEDYNRIDVCRRVFFSNQNEARRMGFEPEMDSNTILF